MTARPTERPSTAKWHGGIGSGSQVLWGSMEFSDVRQKLCDGTLTTFRGPLSMPDVLVTFCSG